MCLIAYANCKKDILNLPLKKIWQANSHGAGIIGYKGNKLYVSKGYFDKKQLTRAIDSLPDNSPIAVHWRLATHGKANSQNCHPFKIDSNTFIMHNGILHGLGEFGDKGHSDTAHLAKILSKLSHKDRLALLSELSGKFLLAHGNKITMHGKFTEYKKVQCSNTSFNETIKFSCNFNNHSLNLFWRDNP